MEYSLKELRDDPTRNQGSLFYLWIPHSCKRGNYSPMRCRKRMPLNEGSTKETYCQIQCYEYEEKGAFLYGHKGPCSIHEDTIPPPPPARCESRSPTRGTQCGLPERHYGNHWNQTTLESWDQYLRPSARIRVPEV